MSTPSQPNHRGRPTADDLAGIPIIIEGKDDGIPRPRPRGGRLYACPPPSNKPPTADDLAGQPVCVEEPRHKSR